MGRLLVPKLTRTVPTNMTPTPELERILWVNPVTQTEVCREWIEAGAAESHTHLLRTAEQS